LIAQGDKILVQKVYSKADFQHNVANQIGTRFHIASLSKSLSFALALFAAAFPSKTSAQSFAVEHVSVLTMVLPGSSNHGNRVSHRRHFVNRDEIHSPK